MNPLLGVVLDADNDNDVSRIKEALQNAGVRQEIISSINYFRNEKNASEQTMPVCWIKYINTTTATAEVDQKKPTKQGIPEHSPLIHIVAKELKLPKDNDFVTALSYVEPTKDGDWKQIADIVNLLVESHLLLENEKQKFNMLLDSFPTGVIYVDSMGRIVDLSSAITDYFYTEENIPANISGELLSETHIGKNLDIEQAARSVLRGQEVSKTNISIERKSNGQSGAINIIGKPIFGSLGDVSGGFLILEDVNTKKILEEKIEQFQALESVGTIAGNMALDFNNMMSAILGHTLFMKERMQNNDPLFPDITAIEIASKNAAELSEKLCNFTKSTQNVVTTIDVNEAVRQVVSVMKRALSQRIAFSWELDPDIRQIVADDIQLRRALINILLNANEALPQGGTIGIKTGYISSKTALEMGLDHAEQGFVWISIQDNGIGMPLEVRDKAFQPFFSTKDSDQHTGMGLAITKRMIEQIEGSIRVESHAGRGSIFTLFLPASSEVVETEIKDKNSDVNNRKTILLVDDEHLIVRIMKSLIEEGGFKVISAASGKEALDLYHEHRHEIDLIVLDLLIPDIHSSRLMERIYAINENAKILLTSSNTTESSIIPGQINRASGFIQKPFRMKHLLKKIEEVMHTENICFD